MQGSSLLSYIVTTSSAYSDDEFKMIIRLFGKKWLVQYRIKISFSLL